MSKYCFLCNIFVSALGASVCVSTPVLSRFCQWIPAPGCHCVSMILSVPLSDQHLVQLQRFPGLCSLSSLFNSLWCVIFISVPDPPLFSTLLYSSLGHTQCSLFLSLSLCLSHPPHFHYISCYCMYYSRVFICFCFLYSFHDRFKMSTNPSRVLDLFQKIRGIILVYI